FHLSAALLIFFLLLWRSPSSTLFPYTTLLRSLKVQDILARDPRLLRRDAAKDLLIFERIDDQVLHDFDRAASPTNAPVIIELSPLQNGDAIAVESRGHVGSADRQIHRDRRT